MMPPLTMFQQLLMQGRGTAPQQGQPQAPQPAPAAAKPSRLDGLLRRYDQFATGGADPSTLNPQQRSLMRRQLAMNIGGAIQQGQPIAAGVSAHGANLAAQQENQLKMQAAQQEAARAAGVQAIFAQQNDGGQMPLGGQGEGGAPASPAQQRMAQREAATRQYQALLAAGFFEDADKFSEQMQRVYPELNLEQVNTGQTVEMVDSRTGQAVNSYETAPTDYQNGMLDNANARLALAQEAGARAAAAAGGGEGPPVIMEVGGERFYRRGNNWERIPAGAAGAAGGAGAAGSTGFNRRQQVGANMVRSNALSFVSQKTGVPIAELETMSPQEVADTLRKKGRRFMEGPVLGRLPIISAIANSDVTPYAVGAGSGQAMINNDTGMITLPDFVAGKAMQPTTEQDIDTQANLVRQSLEGASGGVGNLPAPNAAPVRKRALDASGKQVTLELVNGAWQVVE